MPSQINENVRNILSVVIKTHRFKDGKPTRDPQPADHALLAR